MWSPSRARRPSFSARPAGATAGAGVPGASPPRVKKARSEPELHLNHLELFDKLEGMARLQRRIAELVAAERELTDKMTVPGAPAALAGHLKAAKEERLGLQAKFQASHEALTAELQQSPEQGKLAADLQAAEQEEQLLVRQYEQARTGGAPQDAVEALMERLQQARGLKEQALVMLLRRLQLEIHGSNLRLMMLSDPSNGLEYQQTLQQRESLRRTARDLQERLAQVFQEMNPLADLEDDADAADDGQDLVVPVDLQESSSFRATMSQLQFFQKAESLLPSMTSFIKGVQSSSPYEQMVATAKLAETMTILELFQTPLERYFIKSTIEAIFDAFLPKEALIPHLVNFLEPPFSHLPRLQCDAAYILGVFGQGPRIAGTSPENRLMHPRHQFHMSILFAYGAPAVLVRLASTATEDLVRVYTIRALYNLAHSSIGFTRELLHLVDTTSGSSLIVGLALGWVSEAATKPAVAVAGAALLEALSRAHAFAPHCQPVGRCMISLLETAPAEEAQLIISCCQVLENMLMLIDLSSRDFVVAHLQVWLQRMEFPRVQEAALDVLLKIACIGYDNLQLIVKDNRHINITRLLDADDPLVSERAIEIVFQVAKAFPNEVDTNLTLRILNLLIRPEVMRHMRWHGLQCLSALSVSERHAAVVVMNQAKFNTLFQWMGKWKTSATTATTGSARGPLSKPIGGSRGPSSMGSASSSLDAGLVSGYASAPMEISATGSAVIVDPPTYHVGILRHMLYLLRNLAVAGYLRVFDMEIVDNILCTLVALKYDRDPELDLYRPEFLGLVKDMFRLLRDLAKRDVEAASNSMDMGDGDDCKRTRSLMGKLQYVMDAYFDFSMEELSRETKFGLDEVTALHDQLAPFQKNGRIQWSAALPLITKSFGTNSTQLVQRVFRLFDADGDNDVDFKEFIVGLSSYLRGSPEEKLQLYFRLIDIDGDGAISPEELRQIMRAHMTSQYTGLADQRLAARQAEALALRIFHEIDTNRDGRIQPEEFLAAIRSGRLPPMLGLHNSEDPTQVIQAGRDTKMTKAHFCQMLSSSSGSDVAQIEPLVDKWARAAGSQGRFDPHQFEQALRHLAGIDNPAVSSQFFHAFDADGNGFVDLAEVVSGLVALSSGSKEQKLLLTFRGVDVDRSGSITRDELLHLIKTSQQMAALEPHRAEEIADQIFGEFDQNADGKISFDEFKSAADTLGLSFF